MRTAQECLAKAEELQARAAACLTPDMQQRFQYLADCWRGLTREDGQFGPATLLDFS
ncbi:MAG: hypothetical protein V4597_04870 [Pseudomonadota bacterium]